MKLIQRFTIDILIYIKYCQIHIFLSSFTQVVPNLYECLSSAEHQERKMLVTKHLICLIVYFFLIHTIEVNGSFYLVQLFSLFICLINNILQNIKNLWNLGSS